MKPSLYSNPKNIITFIFLITLSFFIAMKSHAQFVVTATATDVTCYGDADGSAQADPIGGTPPYTYAWSNNHTTQSITNVYAGVYQVTVTDDNGLTATCGTVINTPDPLTTDLVYTHVTCKDENDGSITVNVDGGTPGYIYAWSNSGNTATINNLTAGVYTVTVTDQNGCSSVAEVEILDRTTVCATTAGISQLFYDDWSDNSGNWIYGNGWQVGNGCTPNCGTAPNAFFDFASYTSYYNRTMTSQSFDGCGYDDVFIKYCIRHDIGGPQYQDIQALHFELSNDNGISWTTLKSYYTLQNNWQYIDTLQLFGAEGSDFKVRFRAEGLGGNFFMGGWGIDNLEIKGMSPGYDQITPLSVNIDPTDVTCNGENDGAADLTVNDGIAPYTYNWSNGGTTEDINNLNAGTYSVTITDNDGCTIVQSITINEPSVINASINVQDVFCNGEDNGAVDLTVTGGTAPYSYLWSNSGTTEDINNLSAGTYSVTITDNNNCSITANATVEESSPVTFTVICNHPQCAGECDGDIDIEVSGGTAPYSYNWSNNQNTQDIDSLCAGTYTVTVTDDNGCTDEVAIDVTTPNAITASITTSDYNGFGVSCNGSTDGSCDLTVNGGTTPYSFNWSNSANTEDINNLTAGTYTVTVTDNNGCTEVITATITEPAALTANSTTEDVSCNGGSDGSCDLTTGGGIGSHNYNWSNGDTTEDIDNLTAGTYTVTVTDDNGCSITHTITIDEPAALSATINEDDITCNGGNDGVCDLTANGGTTPYNYNWSNSETTEDINNLSAGTYTVTVTDENGCSIIQSATIDEPAELTANVTTEDVSCNGDADGSCDLTVNGGTAPYSYNWSNSETTEDINNLTAGTYTITVTDDNGCTIEQTVTITEPIELTATITKNDITCNGDNDGSCDLSVNGGTAPYSYNWSNSETTEDINNLSAGTYTVLVTDDNGCSVTKTITINEPAAIVATTNVQDVTCHGGTNGACNLTVNGGTTPYNFDWSNGATNEDVSNLATGNYAVTITDSNGCIFIKPIFVDEPTELTATIDNQHITCNGDNNGACDLTVNGGTAPYTYNWSNGDNTEDVSGLNAGMYYVTITDANGCSTVENAGVNEPLPLRLGYSAEDAQCNGSESGVILTTPFGGTPPFTYNWSNGETTQNVYGLEAGSYNVTLSDANGCAHVVENITIEEGENFDLEVAVTQLTCFEDNTGAIDLTVDEGNAPYTYNWSNNFDAQDQTGLSAGTYTVTVVDANGCEIVETIELTQPGRLDVALTSPLYPNGHNVSEYLAEDGSIDATVVGGSFPYSHYWSNGSESKDLEGLPAGEYEVIVTDNKGCTATDAIILTQPVLIAMPEGISPNGDGRNDKFVVVNIEEYPNNEFVVYNRWGSTVYLQDGYTNQWEGQNMEGKPLPDGTYFVLVRVPEIDIELNGFVEVRRQ